MLIIYPPIGICSNTDDSYCIPPLITCSKAEVVLISKSEFHQAPIRRVVTTADLQALQGEEQGLVAVRGREAVRSTGRGARGARGTTRAPGGATSAARGGRGAGRRPGDIR